MENSRRHQRHGPTCGCQGGGGMGEDWSGSLGLADANFYI